MNLLTILSFILKKIHIKYNNNYDINIKYAIIKHINISSNTNIIKKILIKKRKKKRIE